MHEIRERRLEQSRVTAVFEDRALLFILAKGATRGELSDRLVDPGRRVSTTIELPSVGTASSRRQVGHH